MDEHHSRKVFLSQVVEVRAPLLQSVGAMDGVLLGADVNGLKLVSGGVSKIYQSITKIMHMRSLFIVSTGGPRIHTTVTEEVAVTTSLSLRRGTTGQ